MVDVKVLVLLDVFLLQDVLPLKGTSVVKHFVEQHSETPNVHLVVLDVLVQNFGRQVFLGSTESLPHEPVSEGGAETEIAELDIVGFGEQNILGLDISVHDLLLMQVTKGRDDLREGLEDSFFGEPLESHELPEISAFDEVQQNEELVFRTNGRMHFDDVWVGKSGLNLNFPLNGLQLLRSDLRKLDDFHCVFLLVSSVDAKEYFGDVA